MNLFILCLFYYTAVHLCVWRCFPSVYGGQTIITSTMAKPRPQRAKNCTIKYQNALKEMRTEDGQEVLHTTIFIGLFYDPFWYVLKGNFTFIGFANTDRPCFLFVGSWPKRIVMGGGCFVGFSGQIWWGLWSEKYAILLVCNLLICLWNYPPHLLPLFMVAWSCPSPRASFLVILNRSATLAFFYKAYSKSSQSTFAFQVHKWLHIISGNIFVQHWFLALFGHFDK